jgi:glutathione-independent formaldehyde dehydrogenase
MAAPTWRPAGSSAHENLGEVVEVGAGVEKVRVGDMVCLPFNISCGHCANCEHGLTAFCLRTNPDPNMVGAAYGFAGMGPYEGGQAEMLRVPFADFNCLVLPENARDRDRQRDFVMLADIFPTGWHATQLACVQPGDSVVIYGAGPVGQRIGADRGCECVGYRWTGPPRATSTSTSGSAAGPR